MPKVYNKRTDRNIPPEAILVDRTTQYGNPIRIQGLITRIESIAEFRVYAEERLKREPHWLDELRGKDVVCWCAPLPCHGDVLIELANR
jgi:hypothetical protein